MGSSQILFQSHLEESPQEIDEALAYARKLTELKPEVSEYKYLLGTALELKGEQQKALDVMTFIAPEEKRAIQQDESEINEDIYGNLNAHLWLARHYNKLAVNESDSNTVAKNETLVLQHLDLILESHPNNPSANIQRGDFYLTRALNLKVGSEKRDDFCNNAIEAYERAIGEEIVFLEQLLAVPKLINALTEVERIDDAKKRLESEYKRFLPFARKRPEILGVWYALVGSAVELNDFQLAKDILKEGLDYAITDEVRKSMKMMHASVLISEALEIDDISVQKNYVMRLNLICIARRINLTHRPIYSELLKFIASKSNPEFNESSLRNAMIGAQDSSMVHVLLGIYEINSGRVKQGKSHWQIARQQFPQGTHSAINNLLDVASSDFPEDFSNVYDLFTVAIEMYPDQPIFYVTRGGCLKRDGRYREAISDLEYAVKRIPQMQLLHKSLIECYEATNQPEKAAEQTMALDKLIRESLDGQP